MRPSILRAGAVAALTAIGLTLLIVAQFSPMSPASAQSATGTPVVTTSTTPVGTTTSVPLAATPIDTALYGGAYGRGQHRFE